MSTDPSASDGPLGLRHAHVWQAFTTLPRLQSAHDHLRWDVSKSRIVSFSACAVCDEVERKSLQECDAPSCVEHRICARPYR